MNPLRKNKKAFSKFYDVHIERVYRFVFLKVSTKEVAQDLTTEVFIRFWEQLNSPTEIKNPKAFVYQIARNLVIDHYRKAKFKTIQIEEVQIRDPSPGLEEKEILSSDLEDIQKALEKIPEDHQDIIIWYYLNELTVREIANITGKTENNIRVTIHRALNNLKEELKRQTPLIK